MNTEKFKQEIEKKLVEKYGRSVFISSIKKVNKKLKKASVGIVRIEFQGTTLNYVPFHDVFTVTVDQNLNIFGPTRDEVFNFYKERLRQEGYIND